MGHELVHVSQIAALAGQTRSLYNELHQLLEFHAYSYQHTLSPLQSSSFDPEVIKKLATNYPDWFNKLSYNNYLWTNNYQFTELK